MDTTTIPTVGIPTTKIGGKSNKAIDTDYYLLAEDESFLATESGDLIVRR